MLQEYSRRIIGLAVGVKNNDPKCIAKYKMTVDESKVCRLSAAGKLKGP